jgi:tyrosyl-tRNA synthetase
MGGSDQWGNITTGTELVRRIGKGEGFAFTCPLMTKADGTKFGKTAGGAIWLTADKTSPYAFYQYWLNASDEDAPKYIRTFTFLSQKEIEDIEKEHADAPHLRVLQKRLAQEVTLMVHNQEALDTALAATNILFGKSTAEDLKKLSDRDFLEIFDGVPQAVVSRSELNDGLGIIDALSAKSGFLKSNGEARRELKGNAIAVNKSKVDENLILSADNLINDKYILLSKGKKNNYLIIVE